MKQFNVVKLFLVTVFLSLTAFKSSAQTGNIQGVITDENGIYVPGANVVIESLKKGDITDFDGRFTIVSVPVGTHTLKVSYLGYKDITKEVTVKENETTKVTLELKSGSIELDVIQIKAYRLSGQSRALNTQKNNINITNVVSTDQIGKFPDANIGDAVKRIPGITMQVDQGEARNIIIRGLSPQLNSVTLNGSRIPSAEGDNRNVQMDLIPSDMIQSIQVNKAVTPDMDADALGGAVNLITRTAPQGFRLSSTLGSGVNTITDRRILNGSFLVGDRSENGKFGWMLSASYNDNDFGSDNVEAEWTNEAESPLSGDDIEVNPYIGESDIRTYLVQRVRRSFSANFDYQINDNHNVYLKTMYNWRDDRENRFRLRYRSIEPIFASGTENIIGYQGQIRRQTKGGIDNNRNKSRRLEDQRMQNYTLGGDHLFGKVEFDWMLSYASASEERLNERYIEYELKTNTNNNPLSLNVNLSDPRFPSIIPTSAAQAALSRYDLKEITEENQFTEEKDFNLFLNFKTPMSFVEGKEGFLKFGGRIKTKDKIRNNNFFDYTPLGSEFDNFATLPLVDETDPDFLAGSKYAAGQYVDPTFLGQLNLNNASVFDKSSVDDEFLRDNFDVEENIWAAYLMSNQKLSDQLSVLFGVRFENTKLTATGNVIEDEDTFVQTVTRETSYSNFLPGVHFKYDISKNTVLRFAWTNTIARPNYVDITPFQDVVTGDDEIFIGNPDLDPTTSMNFDINAETYFSNVGLLSGGVFYKSIKDFIYTFQTETTNNDFGPNTTGFDLFQPLNGDDASVFGIELAIQRQLDFLPGFLKNLSVYANYTHITSNANGIRNEDGDVRTDLDLPNTSPNMFNGSLAYADKTFSARLSANFSDAYVDEIGGNAFEDRYYDKQFFLDFNAGFTINSNLRIYADINNITDQPLRYYQGVSNRTMQMEYYGRRITFGLKYDLFKK